MSLASRIDGIDAKLSHEFAAAFGDAVCDELEREGDEALASRLRQVLHIAPTPRRRPRSPMRCTETSNEPGRGPRRVTGVLRPRGASSVRRFTSRGWRRGGAGRDESGRHGVHRGRSGRCARRVRSNDRACAGRRDHAASSVRQERGRSGWLFPSSPPRPGRWTTADSSDASTGD